MELWESHRLTASPRRILITQWVGEAAKKVDVEMGVEYHRRPFDKTGLAITGSGSDDKLINLEGMEGGVSFMDEVSTPEPWRFNCRPRLQLSTRNTRRAQATGRMTRRREEGESNSGANDKLLIATLDVDDDLDEGEEPLSLEGSTGC